MGFGTGIEYVDSIWSVDKTMKAVPDGEFLNIQIKLGDDVEFTPPDKHGIITLKLKANKVKKLWGLLDIMKPPERAKVIIQKQNDMIKKDCKKITTTCNERECRRVHEGHGKCDFYDPNEEMEM